jgi:hypothetical protein
VAITEDDTDLRRCGTLASQFVDVVDDLVGAALEPGRDGTRVWDGRRGDTLAFAVKATHVGGWVWLSRKRIVALSMG